MSPVSLHQTEPYEPNISFPPCKNCVITDRPETIVVKEIYHEPATKVEKPKKSFWQQIFGDGWIGKKKKKREYTHNTTECVDRNCKLCPPKICKPVCGCKEQGCQKGCCPTSRSVCGCQFYFSLENRPKKCCPSRRRNLQSERKKSIQSFPELKRRKTSVLSTITVDEGRKDTLPYSYTNDRRSLSPARKLTIRSVNRPDEQINVLEKLEEQNQIDDRKPSNIQIGVTFTQEQTKYYNPKKNQLNVEECETWNKDLRDDSGKKVTLKICTKTDQNTESVPKVPRRINSSVVLDDYYRITDNPRSESYTREISPLLLRKKQQANDDNTSLGYARGKNNPRSESYTREVSPMLLRKRKQANDDQTSIGYARVEINQPNQAFENLSVQDKEKISMSSEQSSLDKRVSVILEKLHNIEKKINVMEKKNKEQKDLRIDFDGQKSSVSVLVKKPKHKSEENKYDDGNKTCNSKAETVIEIRHAQSKTSSPMERRTSSREELGTTKRQSNRKIIIKIPNIEKCINRSVTLPYNNYRSSYVQNVEATDSDWCDVSNDLKMNPTKIKCYCYNCLCKRNF